VLSRAEQSTANASRSTQSAGAPFGDIPPGFWAQSEVNALAGAGVCTGFSEGLYRPEWGVSRGDIAVYLARALAGSDAAVPAPSGTPSFPDVPASDAAYKHVEYAAAKGIMHRQLDGLYHAELLLDRARMAVFVARALAGGDDSVPEGPDTPTFPDVTSHPDDHHSSCYKHVEYLASRGVVRGYADGRYRPELLCTRAQVAVFLARAFQLSQ